MSEQRYTIHVCPKCGEQIIEPKLGNGWGHRHDDHWVDATAVAIVPADQGVDQGGLEGHRVEMEFDSGGPRRRVLMMPGKTSASQKARIQRIHDLIRSHGIKAEFAKTAKRLMRETPEYAQARKEGRARDWLEQEAASFAESAYALLLTRLEDLDS